MNTSNMSAQHTPGRAERERCNTLARATGLPPICLACHMGPCPNWVAPLTTREEELVSALKTALRHAREAMSAADRKLFDDGDRDGVKRGPEWMFIARAAIAKATGSQA